MYLIAIGQLALSRALLFFSQVVDNRVRNMLSGYFSATAGYTFSQVEQEKCPPVIW